MDFLQGDPNCLREEFALIQSGRRPDELEIQARWFAGEFGTRFQTTGGESVEIIQFGVRNREAGPDFAEAAISINGEEPVRGCIELDFEARDWERHGHAGNPDFEQVALHVFLSRGDAAFFTRTANNRNVPQVLLDLPELITQPPSSQPIAKSGLCASVLRELPGKQASEIIEAAAQFRMRARAARLARLIELHGPDEALYQALATTLGYKSNKLPFTIIAQRLPLRMLLQNKADAESLIFGVSGFLGTADFEQFDRETRAYLRQLWENWWARRAEFERLTVAKNAWRLSGQRPVNHPQRRLAALAKLVREWPKIRLLAQSCEVASIYKFFSALGHEYWDWHYTLASKKSAVSMALIGETRVTDMLANVFFPIAILAEPSRWNGFKKLSAPLESRRVKIAAIRLLDGNPLRKELVKTAAGQQGLLQIYEDFCQVDNSGCTRCPFPKQTSQWQTAP